MIARLVLAALLVDPSLAPPAAPATPPPAGAPVREAVSGIGPVEVRAPAGAPRRTVLVLAAPGAGASALADRLAEGGALVATFDPRTWVSAHQAARCGYPAGDLEVLAQRIEKERAVDSYQRPFVVGHAAGATVAWAAFAQAPAGTFAGAVTVGLCPERPSPLRLCTGSGPKPRRLPGGDLPAIVPAPLPFETITGEADATCPPAAAARLATALAGRSSVVAGAGHALDAALADRAAAAVEAMAPPPPPQPPAADAAVADLPLVEVPAPGDDPRLAVLLTGDGGWVGIDKALAGAFQEAGVATVGLDSLRYFWKKRTPDETAAAIRRIIGHYSAAWHRPEVILVGYSRGADIVPFVPARLPPADRERLRLVAMLGPSTFAEFEVHAIDLFTSRRRGAAMGTEDAVRSAAGRPGMLCVMGSDEGDSLCPELADLPWVKRIVLPGGHHFDGGYAELARLILDAAGRQDAARR